MSSSATGVGMTICFLGAILLILTQKSSQKFGDVLGIMKPVCIGDCVWIGCNVTIAPGAQIGDGCIVSSGSVVFGKIPAHSVIRGNPAIVIGSRDVKTFKKLYSEGKFK